MCGCVRPARDFDLLEKPLRTERRGELGLQHLDGDLAMVLQVLGEIDRRHSPAAKLALDRVAVGEGSLQTCEKISQVGTRGAGQVHHRGQRRARPEGQASVPHFRSPLLPYSLLLP